MVLNNIQKKSICIGVAGDSASGKDTFAGAVVQLLGHDAVTVLSGDNYHFWDREKPAWQVVTHLNPMANDLSRYAKDLATLIAGGNVELQEYDHTSGKSGGLSLIKANQIIIAQGLHALYLPEMRSQYDLKIYLDVEEDIRRRFKIKRDVRERGHNIDEVLAVFERRESDSIDFVRPQAEYADVVFSVKNDSFQAYDTDYQEDEFLLCLEIKTTHTRYSESLVSNLVGTCLLEVDLSFVEGCPVLLVRGGVEADLLSRAAINLCPKALKLTSHTPLWQKDIVGIIQLMILYQVELLLRQ